MEGRMKGRISSQKKRKLSPGYGKELKEREGLKTQRRNKSRLSGKRIIRGRF